LSSGPTPVPVPQTTLFNTQQRSLNPVRRPRQLGRRDRRTAHHSSTHQHSPQHSDPHPAPDNEPVGMDPAPSHSDHHRQPPAHRRGHGNGHHLLPPRRPQTTPAHRSHRPRSRDTNRQRHPGRLRHRTVVNRLVKSRCPVL